MDENLIDGSIRIKYYIAKYDPHSNSNYSAPINNSHCTPDTGNLISSHNNISLSNLQAKCDRDAECNGISYAPYSRHGMLYKKLYTQTTRNWSRAVYQKLAVTPIVRYNSKWDIRARFQWRCGSWENNSSGNVDESVRCVECYDQHLNTLGISDYTPGDNRSTCCKNSDKPQNTTYNRNGEPVTPRKNICKPYPELEGCEP